MKPFWCAAWLGLMLAGCGGTIVSKDGTKFRIDSNNNIVVETPRCSFEYSKEVKEKLLPILKARLGRAMTSYDTDKPEIIFYSARVQLLFGPRLTLDLKNSDGSFAVDSSDLEIDMDVCSHDILKTEFVTPTEQ